MTVKKRKKTGREAMPVNTGKKQGGKRTQVPQKPYERSEHEQAVVQANEQRRSANIQHPKIDVRYEDQQPKLVSEHQDVEVARAMALESFGASNADFVDILISQLVGLQNGEKIDATRLNQTIAEVVGVGPRDEVEAMLATQMAAVHQATMHHAALMARTELFDHLVAYGRALGRLSKTFTSQVEALAKYRSKGQQKMTVEHVHVHEGGQAIVGQVNGEQGVSKNSEGQPHAKQATHAPGETVWSQDQERETVPSPSNG